MHFLANENFPAQSVKQLRESGLVVVSVQEDMPGASDRAILERACRDNLIILTFDKDYGELIYRYHSFVPGGLVFFRFNPETPEEPYALLSMVLADERVSIAGKYTIVDRKRIRQRNLR